MTVSARSSAQDPGDDGKDSSLGTLDSLLGDASGAKPAGKPEMIEWWKVKPRQSAPPRQFGMAPGSHGRFVMNEDFLRMNELRVGRKTELGSQLELPRVQPVVSFLLLAVTAGCYATYVGIAAQQGPDAAAEFMSGLATSDQLMWGGAGGAAMPLADWVLRPVAATFMAPSPLQLVVAVWGLLMVAPRAEQVLGYATFTAVFLLSGATGNMVQLALQSPDAAGGTHSGAVAALLGVAASLATHHLRNRGLEAQAASFSRAPVWDASTLAASSTSSPLDLDDLLGASQQPAAPASPRAAAPAPQSPAAASSSSSSQGVPDSGQLVQTAGVAGVLLALTVAASQDGGALGLPASLAGLAAGAVLTWGMGPWFSLQQEVDIPEGSMTIPEDAREMVVVVDRTSGTQRALVAGSYAAALLLLTVAGQSASL
uniref:Peptidase S54 rhomboid domain-containing protein n=1 Tax=Chlamydomonas leiostraca TaxID=1034604 RepID=A0A6T8QV16_9CHLO